MLFWEGGRAIERMWKIDGERYRDREKNRERREREIKRKREEGIRKS